MQYVIRMLKATKAAFVSALISIVLNVATILYVPLSATLELVRNAQEKRINLDVVLILFSILLISTSGLLLIQGHPLGLVLLIAGILGVVKGCYKTLKRVKVLSVDIIKLFVTK